MDKITLKPLLTGIIILNQVSASFGVTLNSEKQLNDNCVILSAAEIASGVCGVHGSENEGDMTWSFDSDGTLRISGVGNMGSELPWRTQVDISKITKLIIEDGVTDIWYGAFYQCKNLVSVTIPNSVTKIGAEAFEFTPWLDNQRMENPLVIVNSILIDGSRCSKDVVIPENVTTIGESAFSGCTSMTSIIIPNGVTNIGGYAFSRCNRLSSITIPDTVVSIGQAAFKKCTNLKSVTLPIGITSIESQMFSDCTTLNSIIIPQNVKVIQDKAFYNCQYLNSVSIESEFSVILGDQAFEYTSDDMKIYVPTDKYDYYIRKWDVVANRIDTLNMRPSIPSSEPPTTSINIKKGDLDSNGNIDVTDLTMLSLYLVGDQVFTNKQIKAADVTGDDYTDLADLARLRQFLSKKIDKLDVE